MIAPESIPVAGTAGAELSPTIIELFQDAVGRFPDKIAVCCGPEELTYAALAEQVRRLSAQLSRAGVGPGTRVILLLGNGIEFTVTLLAAANLGAVIAALSPTSGTSTVARAAEAIQATFLIGASHAVGPLVARSASPLPRNRIVSVGDPVPGCLPFAATSFIPPPGYALGDIGVRPEDDYVLTLTSGSTGTPKPIVLSQAIKVARSLRGARDLYGLGDQDVIITSSPMFHSLGFRLALLPLLTGATSVILRQFTPTQWLETVARRSVTFAILVSAQIERLLGRLPAESGQLSTLRNVVSSSAPLREDTKREAQRWFGCAFHECYGASEVGIVTNLGPHDGPDTLGSVGTTLPYVDLKIIDRDGREAPPGRPGEIVCRTATAFSRYDGNETATRDAWLDGYFRTGDLGYLDSRGYLYLCGRLKDIIMVGGANVYPEDVEAVVMDCPGVKECAVIGVEDPLFGEAVLAVVVEAPPGADLRAIREQCARELADYQQPMAFERVDALPRTELGKIQRAALRAQFAGYDATALLRQMLPA